MVELDPSAEFASADRTPHDTLVAQSAKLTADPLIRTIVDSSRAFITVLNSHRQIVFTNRSTTDAVGATFQSALGRRPGELVGCVQAASAPGGCGTGPACSTCGANLAILSAQRGNKTENECRIVTTGGAPIDLLVTAAPLDVDGEHYTMFTAVDIGDRKRRHALERIFFHDIMNTAIGVQGLSAALGSVDCDEGEELIQLIGLASQHMIDEIGAQRELLAAETDDLVVHPVPIESRAILTDVTRLYATYDIAIGKSLVVDPACEDIEFVSDATLLGRVISNLVKNALEATSDGGAVTVNCTLVGEHVAFSVHNDAVIPPRAQLQIFQRSFSTKGEGRGLGTYSARLLTERYLGGVVRFESAAESGTTFTVSLPVEGPTA